MLHPGSSRTPTGRIGSTDLLLALFLSIIAASAANAQSNPVHVDDSPTARQLFARAMDHTEDNVGEAVRVFQELLDDYPDRLLATGSTDADGSPNRYVTVRTRVIDALLASPSLLERYQQAEQARARRMLESASYESLATTRPLTTSGLEAMLTLAQQHLEGGHFNAAIRWLDEAIDHPDLADDDALTADRQRRAAHLWHMLGLIADHNDQLDQFHRALDQLARLGRHAEPLKHHLEERHRHRRDRQRTQRERTGQTVFDIPVAVGFDELIAEEVWSVPLEDSLHQRRKRNTDPDRPTMMGRSLRQNLEEGHYLTAVPTVYRNAVYINQGHRIAAYDRISGTPIWDRDHIDRPHATVIDRDDQPPRDLNTIAVQDDALVTITGHAHATGRSLDGRIIHLNARTGELVWRTALNELDPTHLGQTRSRDDFDDLFPSSNPVIVDDHVIFLARRVTRQSLTSVYLIALDLESGQARWARHIVSSSSARRAARAFSAIIADRSDLYINSPVGAAARIDAHTGAIHWLHRFPVSINPHPIDRGQKPWELITPIVLDDRVVIITPGFQQIAVLDRATGASMAEIDTTSRDGWNNPHYLVAGTHSIISVGSDIRAFDPLELDRPKWVLPVPVEHRQSPMDGQPAAPAMDEHEWFGPFEPYGRVQVVREPGDDDDAGPSHVIVPNRGGVLVAEERTGRVLVHLPIGEVGNVVGAEAQLLVAGNDTLHAYMSMTRAEELMRERLARSPSDPAPALGLARLGVRIGRFELVMEASELTMQAVERARDHGGSAARDAEQLRDDLLELLLAADIERMIGGSSEPSSKPSDAPRADGSMAPLERAERLFALIDSLVAAPSERVAAILNRGDWLRSRDPGRAVETWQEILADDELGRVVWDPGLSAISRQLSADSREPTAIGRQPNGAEPLAVIYPAKIVAIKRIVGAMEEFGEHVYDASAAFAAMRVEQLLAGSSIEPGRLLAIARQFPLSPAAERAAIEAAQAWAERGEVSRALDVLVEVDRLASKRHPAGAASMPPLLERYIALAASHDRFGAAADAAGYAIERYGLEQFDQAMSARRGVADRVLLGDSLLELWSSPQRARIGSPASRARVVEGWLVDDASRSAWGESSADRGWRLAAGPAERAVEGGRSLVLLETERDGQSELMLMGLPEQTKWSVPLDGRRLEVVAWGENKVLIGYDDTSGRRRVAGVNLADGRVRWVTAAMEDSPAEHRENDTTAVRINGDSVVLVRGDGTVAGFTIDRERLTLSREPRTENQSQPTVIEPAWVVDRAAERAGPIEVAAGLVMMIGNQTRVDRRRGSARMQLMLAVIDAVTGEARFERRELPFSGEGVNWIQATAMGSIVYGSDEGIAKVDARSGELIWANRAFPAQMSPRGWMLGVNLIIEDRGGNLRRLDLMSGELGPSFDVPQHGDWQPLHLTDVMRDGDDLIARYRQRFVRYDLDGNVLGADMILDDRNDEWLLRGEDRFVLVSNLTERGDGRLRVREEPTTYRIYVLSPNGRLLSEPVDLTLPELLHRIDQATLRDGWLLLSTGDWTFALPMPAE